MDKSIRFFKWNRRFRASISYRKVVEVSGVNNKIDETTFFLMWDFDGADLREVKAALRYVQIRFNLPTIHILTTGKEGGYHGYCFKACEMEEARGIIGFTPSVDNMYLTTGCRRGYFTLRFTPVPGREFAPICVLFSQVPAELTYKDVTSFVDYTKAVDEDVYVATA